MWWKWNFNEITWLMFCFSSSFVTLNIVNEFFITYAPINTVYCYFSHVLDYIFSLLLTSDLCCQTRPLLALSRRGAAKNGLPHYNATAQHVWRKRVSRPLSGGAGRTKSGSRRPISLKTNFQGQNCNIKSRNSWIWARNSWIWGRNERRMRRNERKMMKEGGEIWERRLILQIWLFKLAAALYYIWPNLENLS